MAHQGPPKGREYHHEFLDNFFVPTLGRASPTGRAIMWARVLYARFKNVHQNNWLDDALL